MKIDFYRDYVNFLREQLQAGGYEVSERLNDQDIELSYFSVLKRRIAPVPRKVLKAIDFVCSPEHQEALDEIFARAGQGRDLMPYQTKNILKLKDKDLLLYDWGIHHFHLGTIEQYDRFVKRTTKLLFAWVTDKHFCAIKIGNHDDWGKIELLETMHRCWPELLARFRMACTTGGDSVSEDKLVRARNAGLQPLIALSDGTTYLPPGGGLQSSGDSSDAVMYVKGWRRCIAQWEIRAKKLRQVVLAKAKEKGWRPGQQLEAHLIFQKGRPYLEAPGYRLRLPLAGE